MPLKDNSEVLPSNQIFRSLYDTIKEDKNIDGPRIAPPNFLKHDLSMVKEDSSSSNEYQEDRASEFDSLAISLQDANSQCEENPLLAEDF